MQRNYRNLRLKFMSYWHRLITPFLRIEDAEQQRFAVRVAIMLACAILATSFLVVITRLGVSVFPIVNDLMPVLTVFFTALFVLNLQGWHSIVIRISIFSMEMVIIVIWITNVDTPAVLVLNYLILVVFISSRLLPLNEVIVQSLINCIVLGILNIAVPHANYLPETLLFNVIFSAAVIFVTASRLRDLQRTRETEERYRNLMDANFEPVAILDLKSRILDVNLAFEKLSGFTVKELLGRSIVSLLTPESGAYIMANFGRIGTELLRANAINAQGDIIPIETHSRLSTYKDIPALTIIVRNLAHESAIEREKRDYELRYKAIFENTHDGVYIIDLEGNYMDANPRGWDMLGISPENFIGTKVSQFIVEEEKTQSANVIQRLINDEFIPDYERRFRRKTGELFYGEVFAMLVRDQMGEPLYIQSVVRDITERKRIAENRLELRIQQERNSVLKQLINDFSHYVRTPLANIKNSSYLITKITDVERQKEHGSIIDGEIERLVSLLDDLLTLARIEPESEKQTVLALDVVEIVRNVVPTPIGSGLADDSHQWSFHTLEMPITVFGNRMRLSDVFRRLMLNARHYTLEGGKIEVDIERRDDLNAVCIAITDTGIGIAPNDVAHIFETFYRADDAREMNSISSGLGLSICQKIVEIHRGVIRVTSTLGVGSRFEVWLPLDLTTVLTL